MKICCLSDIHGYLPAVPECDLLLLGGDYCRDHHDTMFYIGPFTEWLETIAERGTKIIGVAGNHDFWFEDKNPVMRSGSKQNAIKLTKAWTYLQDSGTEWNELNFYGVPHQLRFYDWAFNLDEPDLAEKWSNIPNNTDILLLHGPPYGYGDFSPYGKVHTGSPSLTRRIEELNLKLVIYGHIHSGFGMYKLNDTILINAAHVN